MAVTTDIAEAVKDELNAASLSQELTAERHYQPVFELPEMKTLHVTVVAKGVTIETASRGMVRHDYEIDVAVQKKFDLPAGRHGEGDSPELDELMTLTEEVGDFFRLRRLEAAPHAVCVKIENAPVYSQEHMEQFRQFTSVLTLTFRVLR